MTYSWVHNDQMNIECISKTDIRVLFMVYSLKVFQLHVETVEDFVRTNNYKDILTNA